MSVGYFQRQLDQECPVIGWSWWKVGGLVKLEEVGPRDMPSGDPIFVLHLVLPVCHKVLKLFTVFPTFIFTTGIVLVTTKFYPIMG